MGRITIAFLLLVCLCLTRPAQAQLTAVQQHNARMMDSLQMEVIAIWCHGQLDFPSRYSRHRTEQLVHILRTLNTLYTDTLSRAGLTAGIDNLREGRLTVDTLPTGDGTTSIVVKINLPDYLQARLQFTCAGERVVAQRYELQPETRIWANDHNQNYVDFNYCKTVYAPALNFPVQYTRKEYFYASLGL
jgi:hypothetical protein